MIFNVKKLLEEFFVVWMDTFRENCHSYQTVEMFHRSVVTIDILFTWILLAVSKLVITVDWFSAYKYRKAVLNALWAVYKQSLLTA
mgnify:CR=1 FL=1